MLVPKEYAAFTKVSDEYKETDIAIGLGTMQAQIKKALSSANSGINDIEVYSQWLTSKDFARHLSNVRLPGKGITYGQHLGGDDPVEATKEHIGYKISYKEQTLTVQFTDRDPAIASLMLDTVMAHLQTQVSDARHAKVTATLHNIERNAATAQHEYTAAEKAYTDYCDSHVDSELMDEELKKNALKKDMDEKFSRYRELSEQVTRQQMLQKRSTYSFAVIKSNNVSPHTTVPFLGYWAACVLIMIMVVVIMKMVKRCREKDFSIDFGGITSPWAITIAIWTLMLIALCFRDPKLLNAPDEQFYISLVIWLFTFTTASVCIYNVMAPRRPLVSAAELIKPLDVSPLCDMIFNFFLMLSIVMTPMYLKKIYDVVFMFGTEDFMSNVRNYAVNGDMSLGLLFYCNIINMGLLLVAAWRYPRIKLWKLLWCGFACILNALAIMEKGGFLLVFFVTFFILFEKKIVKLRSIAILSVVMILFFYLFNIMRAEEDSDYSKNETIFGFLTMYLLSPPVAYCQVTPDVGTYFGSHSLTLLYYYLDSWGVGHYDIPTYLQEFVFVPVPTNVYTIFQPFYLDFGQTGIAVFGTIYGLMCGILYRYRQNGNAFARCFYVYIAYVLALQFFQEYIFSTMLSVPRLIIVIYLLTQTTLILMPPSAKTPQPTR